MLKKVLSLLLSVLSVLSLFAACNGAENTNSDISGEYTFSDGAGKTVSVKYKPERVAVLFSSFADMWRTAGGNIDITVGESVERGFADEKAVLVDSGAGKTIDTETLIASKPDFVICSADIAAQVKTAEVLYQADIPCAQIRVESFADYLNILKIFTDILQTPENYTRFGTDIEDKINALKNKIPANAQKKSILFIRSGSSASSAKAKTASEHFAAAMLQELGAYNIADKAPVLLDGLSFEEILIQEPEMIFITTMGDEAAAKAYMESVLKTKAWQSLDAVKNDRCIFLPKELFQFKPNAKWFEAYKYLAQLLYPEIDF